MPRRARPQGMVLGGVGINWEVLEDGMFGWLMIGSGRRVRGRLHEPHFADDREGIASSTVSRVWLNRLPNPGDVR